MLKGVLMRAVSAVLCLCAAALAVAAPAYAGDPIMPLSQVHKGMKCTGRSVVSGTDIATFDVEVIDVVVGGSGVEGPQILVRASGPAIANTGIGAGFSGSPIYCPDDAGVQRIIGAIANGLGEYGNSTVLATPIESILGESADPPTGARSDPRMLSSARPLAVPLTVSGLSGPLARAVSLAAGRVHRRVVLAPAAPALSYPPQTLRPGSSFAVGLASGNLGLSAVGTVAYTDGDRVWGFGHPLDGAGRRSLLLQDAYVYTVIGNPLGLDEAGATSYKLASPGHDLGTLTNDAPDAVVGRVGPLPPQVPMNVTARDGDTGRIEVTSGNLVDETGVDLPTGVSVLALGGTLGVVSPAVSILRGSPARETASLCLRISLRERRKPLGFCNRYVGAQSLDLDSGGSLAIAVAGMAADVSGAALLIDDYEAGPLHVEGVSANLVMRRGARQAVIVGASGPRTVRAGGVMRVRLRLARRDGTRRTLRLKVHVPGSVRGLRRLQLRGTPLDNGDLSDLLGAIGSSITIDIGGDEEPPVGPHSVAALARTIAGIHRYDGIRARFAGPRGGPGRGAPTYRDPRERISGRADLPVTVLAP
jgi:hypothetical protein